MRYLEITNEVEYVSQEKYPHKNKSKDRLAYFNRIKSYLKLLKNINQDISIYNNPKQLNEFIIFFHRNAIGYIDLVTNSENERLKNSYNIHNVYIKSEFRRQGMISLLYKFLILDKNLTLTAHHTQTPSSSKIWISLFNNEKIDVYGLNISIFPETNFYPINFKKLTHMSYDEQQETLNKLPDYTRIELKPEQNRLMPIEDININDIVLIAHKQS